MRWVPFLFVAAVVAFLAYATLLMTGIARLRSDDVGDGFPWPAFAVLAALVSYALALGVGAFVTGRRRAGRRTLGATRQDDGERQ